MKVGDLKSHRNYSKNPITFKTLCIGMEEQEVSWVTPHWDCLKKYPPEPDNTQKIFGRVRELTEGSYQNTHLSLEHSVKFH